MDEKKVDLLIRESLKTFAQMALSKRGDNLRASETLKISKSTIEQMKSSGKGSVTTWIKLFTLYANISPAELENFLTCLPTLIKDLKPESKLDNLFEQVKSKYTEQEVASMLKLFLSKKEVESFLGVDVKLTSKTKKN